jgi:hypothetical protein
MPSHQDRREPLPETYQYGDGRYNDAVVIPKRVFGYLVERMCFIPIYYVTVSTTSYRIRSFYIKDVLFMEGD